MKRRPNLSHNSDIVSSGLAQTLVRSGIIGAIGLTAGAMLGAENRKETDDTIQRCESQLQKSRSIHFRKFAEKVFGDEVLPVRYEVTFTDDGKTKVMTEAEVATLKASAPGKNALPGTPEKFSATRLPQSYEVIQELARAQMEKQELLKGRAEEAIEFNRSYFELQWVLVHACQRGYYFRNVWGDLERERAYVPGWRVWDIVSDFHFRVASLSGPSGVPLLRDQKMTSNQSKDLLAFSTEIDLLSKALFDDMSCASEDIGTKEVSAVDLLKKMTFRIDYIERVARSHDLRKLAISVTVPQKAMMTEMLDSLMAHTFANIRSLCVKHAGGEKHLQAAADLESSFLEKDMKSQSSTPESLETKLKTLEKVMTLVADGNLAGATEIKKTFRDPGLDILLTEMGVVL